jgi:hypothetical protein
VGGGVIRCVPVDFEKLEQIVIDIWPVYANTGRLQRKLAKREMRHEER